MVLRALLPLSVVILFSLLGVQSASVSPSASVTGDEPCTGRDSRGRVYDLRALTQPVDYEVKNERGESIFINVCRSIVTETLGISSPERVGIYLDTERGGLSLGSFNTSLIINNDSVSMVYKDGSSCPSQPIQRASIISFRCNSLTWGPGHPEYVGSIDDCTHFFVWPTSHACPSEVTRGFWGAVFVFLSVFLIALVVYFISGVAYNRVVLKQRGWQQFPQFTFLWTVTDFIKDMTIIMGVYILDKLQFLKEKVVGEPTWS